MRILKEKEGKNFFLDTDEINLSDVPSLNNKIVQSILKIISKEPMYPKQIAKKINVHEQNVYYYIKKLEKCNIIRSVRSENINGTIANFYTTAHNSFFFRFSDFKEGSTVMEKESNYLAPFIENGQMNSIIVVGSPDPHGPQKARARDGYYGMDLALFLGSFLHYIPESKVRLDTEVTNEMLKNNHLVIIGGPIVNKVTGMINKKMPINFDEEKKGIYSTISKKTYFNDEIGMINKFRSPFNPEKMILLVAGIRNSGTKSAILAFLKNFSEVKKNNNLNSKIASKVVEGIDLDSDGLVDNVEFLE